VKEDDCREVLLRRVFYLSEEVFVMKKASRVLWAILVILGFVILAGGCGGGGSNYYDTGGSETGSGNASVFNGSWRSDNLSVSDGSDTVTGVTGYLTVTPVSGSNAAKSITLSLYYSGTEVDDPLDVENLPFSVNSSDSSSITISVAGDNGASVRMTYYYSSSNLYLSMKHDQYSIDGTFVPGQKSASAPASETKASESDLGTGIKNLINALGDKN
jgi:hypothetical protein